MKKTNLFDLGMKPLFFSELDFLNKGMSWQEIKETPFYFKTENAPIVKNFINYKNANEKSHINSNNLKD